MATAIGHYFLNLFAGRGCTFQGFMPADTVFSDRFHTSGCQVPEFWLVQPDKSIRLDSPTHAGIKPARLTSNSRKKPAVLIHRQILPVRAHSLDCHTRQRLANRARLISDLMDFPVRLDEIGR
jgi:hypothetical protein